MRRICTTAVAAGLIALAALPGTASAGELTVRSVSAPRSATAGLGAEVQAGIGRKGRTPAATVRFYLSANAKRDRRDVRLKGDARVARGRRSGTVRVAARLQVPAA